MNKRIAEMVHKLLRRETEPGLHLFIQKKNKKKPTSNIEMQQEKS